MAVTTHTESAEAPRFTRKQIALFLLGLAVLFAIARPVLPAWFVERPDDSGVFPFADWLDALFDFLRYTLGLEALTRWFASNPLKFLLDASATRIVLCRVWDSSTWTTPAGKINQHETGRDAAARETYEETGFDPHATSGATKEMRERSADGRSDCAISHRRRKATLVDQAV